MKIPMLSLEEACSEGLEGLLAEETGDPRFRELLHRHFARNAGHLVQLRRIGASLHSRGTEAIVLKGASLLGEVYPQLGARPMGDIDLLVRPEDTGKALQCLRTLGYVQCDMGLVGPGAHVDLHQRLTGQQSVRPEAGAYDFCNRLVWSESVPTALPGIRRLSWELQALHLAVHALKHSYTRLIWLVDLGRVLKRTDTTRLNQLARETKSQRALAYVRYLLDCFEGRPVSNRAALSWLERKALDAAYHRRLPPRAGMLLMALSLDAGRRLRYLRELSLPSRSQWHARHRELGFLRFHGKRLARTVRAVLSV